MGMPEAKVDVKEEKRSEWIAKFKELLHEKPFPYDELVKAAEEERSLTIDFDFL